jgi:hypothetical protein
MIAKIKHIPQGENPDGSNKGCGNFMLIGDKSKSRYAVH